MQSCQSQIWRRVWGDRGLGFRVSDPGMRPGDWGFKYTRGLGFQIQAWRLCSLSAPISGPPSGSPAPTSVPPGPAFAPGPAPGPYSSVLVQGWAKGPFYQPAVGENQPTSHCRLLQLLPGSTLGTVFIVHSRGPDLQAVLQVSHNCLLCFMWHVTCQLKMESQATATGGIVINTTRKGIICAIVSILTITKYAHASPPES